MKQKQYHEWSTFYHTQCDFSLVFSQLWETWHTNNWQLSNYSKVAGNWFLSDTDRAGNLCEMCGLKPHVGDAEGCCIEQLVCHQKWSSWVKPLWVLACPEEDIISLRLIIHALNIIYPWTCITFYVAISTENYLIIFFISVYMPFPIMTKPNPDYHNLAN